MPTVSKELAKKIIREARKQKRPRVYCVVEDFDPIFEEIRYAFCNNEAGYESLVRGSESLIKILWASKRFRDARKGKLSPCQRRAKKFRSWFYKEVLDDL